MIRLLWILSLIFALSACSYFNLNKNKADDQYARCKELKRRIIFNSASNNDMVITQKNAELENLNRTYRDEGC
jgi:hypothetical protein